jgi:hypothetical protein
MDQGVDKDSICQTCGKNELVFAEPNTTEHFCQWLFSGENEGVTVIAHNLIESLPVVGLIPHEEDFSVFQFHGIRVIVVYVW